MIESEDEWDRLAKVVTREAHQVRMPRRVLNFDELRDRHAPLVKKELRELEEQRTDDSEEWITHVKASLSTSVQGLCARSVLYQGYEWRCGTCYHTNWNQIDALEPLTGCEVCGATQIAPVDKPWDFRLNGFLREALMEHGILALVWCLIMLERRVRETFFFLGPHDLFVEYPDNDWAVGDCEVDLICVLDGKVHLCEVKSSGRGIEIEPLLRIARRIRPDVVTLAVHEHSSRRVVAKFEEIKRELSNEEIVTKLLTLSDDDLEEGALLPN